MALLSGLVVRQRRCKREGGQDTDKIKKLDSRVGGNTGGRLVQGYVDETDMPTLGSVGKIMTSINMLKPWGRI